MRPKFSQIKQIIIKILGLGISRVQNPETIKERVMDDPIKTSK